MIIDRKVSDEDSLASIAKVQKAWLDAVKFADFERLIAMVTDDIVVVHRNGRSLRGKDELKADFVRAFEAFSIEQSAFPVDVVIRGKWAFEISEINTDLTPRAGGESQHIHSTALTVLHQDPQHSWKVARVLGLLD